jgi:hypothetical protein
MATKITVQLPDHLYQRTQRFARLHQQEMEEAISALLEQALEAGEAEEEILDWSEPDPAVDREMKAYIAMHPMLRQHYRGQHVAIYGGQLIDHDQDFEALFKRIEQAYPDEFVWLATVEEEPLPTIYHRSPRLVRDR